MPPFLEVFAGLALNELLKGFPHGLLPGELPHHHKTDFILLIFAFFHRLPPFCGMAMSGHAVPFLYGMLPVLLARQAHLSFSHWSFVIMGLHLGIHLPLMTAKLHGKKRGLMAAVFCVAATAGLFFFFKNGIYNYLFFRVPFAFLDYEKSPVPVFAENVLILLFSLLSVCRQRKYANIRIKTAAKIKNKGVLTMSKKLVAYFSASGTTAAKAKALAKAADADLYEIKPETAYTKSDLNWMNPLSRSSKEMKNGIKPALADTNAKTENYDVIFVGFPIWWYVAPTVINSFLEAYDFSGKKIVLFATSGGSGFGKTVESLQGSAPNAQIVEGKILNGVFSDEELKAFADRF